MRVLLLFTGKNAGKYAENDNATQMAYSLLELGLDVDIQASNLADSINFTRDFAQALEQYNIVIVIGGMGDDYIKNAKEIICDGLDVSMVVHQPSLIKLERLCEKQNREMTEKDLEYIKIPDEAKAFDHSDSVIPGFSIVSGEQSIIMLPDNGEVYVDLFSKNVIPYLIEWLQLKVLSVLIYPFGLTDRQAKQQLYRLKGNRRPLISIFSRGNVASIIQILEHDDGNSDAETDVADAEFIVKGFLNGLYTHHPIDIMARKVVGILREAGFTIAVAESLTEGLLARNFKVAKRYDEVLKGDVASLLNIVKHEEMNVPIGITENFLDSSEEMAVAMAHGIMEKFSSDIGISICGGMASDGRGGFDSTAYIALITAQGVKVSQINLFDLSVSKDQAYSIFTIYALNMVYEFVEGLPESVRDLVGLASGSAEDIQNTSQILRYRAESKKQILEERFDENQKIQSIPKEYMDAKPIPVAEVIEDIQPGEKIDNSFEPNRIEMTMGFRGIANPEEHSKVERLATATIAEIALERFKEEGGQKNVFEEEELDVVVDISEKKATDEEVELSSLENNQLILEQETDFYKIVDENLAINEQEGKEPIEMAKQSKFQDYTGPENTPSSKGNGLKIALILVIVVAIIGILSMGVANYLSNQPQTVAEAIEQYKAVEAGTLTVREPKDYPENYPDRYIPLYKINPDVQAVVEISTINLALPIVQTGDNVTYTETDFFLQASNNGTPYLDYRSNVDPTKGNALVYGASISGEDALSVLSSYQDIRFSQDHPTLTFDTVDGGGDYAIFATFIAGTDNSRSDVYDFGKYIKAVDVDTFTEMVEDVKSRSITEFPVEVMYGDEVVMLTTEINDFEDAQFVLVARKFREDEKPEVNSSLMELNANPLYPSQWYELYGGEKPDLNQHAQLIDLSLTQIQEEPEVIEEVVSEPPVSSTPPTSSVIPSSQPVSSIASSSDVSSLSSTVSSSSTSSSSSSTETSASTGGGGTSSSVNSTGDGWVDVSAIDETSSRSSSNSENMASSAIENGNTGTTGSTGSSGQGGTLTVSVNGSTMTGDAQEIVAKIVAAEMGSGFSEEALKAQAVAAYSYILYENAQGKSPTVYMGTPNSKINNAVSSVIGQKVTYGGKVAYTTYYAMSAGQTNSSTDVWGGSIPYLVTVNSPWDTSVASYKVNKTFSEAEVRKEIEAMGITVTGDPSTWFEVTSTTASGYNENMLICGQSKTASGKKITGRYLREAVFNLRSAAFDVSYSNGNFTFTTYGYGHGVGMSQWGANGMAKEGYTYREILAHYFPGTSVS